MMIKKNMKFILASVLAIILGIALAVGLKYTRSTLAYLFSNDKLANKVVLNDDRHEIVEHFTKPTTLKKETEIKKNITIQNNSKVEQFVRARLLLDEAPDKVLEYSLDGINFYTLEDYIPIVAQNNWEYNAQEGIFYYTKELKSLESTLPLVTNFRLTLSDMDNLNRGASIYVKSDSIQTIDANGAKFSNAQAAFKELTKLTKK